MLCLSALLLRLSVGASRILGTSSQSFNEARPFFHYEAATLEQVGRTVGEVDPIGTHVGQSEFAVVARSV